MAAMLSLGLMEVSFEIMRRKQLFVGDPRLDCLVIALAILFIRAKVTSFRLPEADNEKKHHPFYFLEWEKQSRMSAEVILGSLSLCGR